MAIPKTLAIVDEFTMVPGDARFSDYEFLGEGPYGITCKAKTKEAGQDVWYALKFFGYTSKVPDVSAINNEIMLMVSLKGMSGAVQIVSVFKDIKGGYITGTKKRNQKPIIKRYSYTYPVIVMELLSLQYLYVKDSITIPVSISSLRCLLKANNTLASRQNTSSDILPLSKNSASIFCPLNDFNFIREFSKDLFEALKTIHEGGHIHRDIKIENILVQNQELSSDSVKLKISDFFHMIRLDSKVQDTVVPPYFKGCDNSSIIYAPETLSNYTYSQKSDVWQAGIILYSLVFSCDGLPQVVSNIMREILETKDNERGIALQQLKPLLGSDIGIDSAYNSVFFPQDKIEKLKSQVIESEAESILDLLSGIFKHESKRMGVEEILRHQWFNQSFNSSRASPLSSEVAGFSSRGTYLASASGVDSYPSSQIGPNSSTNKESKDIQRRRDIIKNNDLCAQFKRHITEGLKLGCGDCNKVFQMIGSNGVIEPEELDNYIKKFVIVPNISTSLTNANVNNTKVCSRIDAKIEEIKNLLSRSADVSNDIISPCKFQEFFDLIMQEEYI